MALFCWDEAVKQQYWIISEYEVKAMNNIEKLIMDRDYLIALLNGPCVPGTEEHVYSPLRREWIDEERTQNVTQAMKQLLLGEREDIKSAVDEIVRYFRDELGYPVCEVTEQWR